MTRADVSLIVNRVEHQAHVARAYLRIGEESKAAPHLTVIFNACREAYAAGLLPLVRVELRRRGYGTTKGKQP